MSFINNCVLFNSGLLFIFCIFIALSQISWKKLPLLLFGLSGLTLVLLQLTQTEISTQLIIILGVILLTSMFLYAFKKLSWKGVPTFLFGVAGLLQLFYWLAPSIYSENAFLQNNYLLFIALIAMIIVDRKVILEGYQQIFLWLKTRFTHESIR